MLKNAALGATHPHEGILESGDILFLPPFWLHAAEPLEGISVAVNVFFRNLDGAYAVGRDVYGNRDLQAYEQGRRDVARVGKALQSLPRDVRRFYAHRLAAELQQAGDMGED
jgi:tRNA wybutosine-synthesizing protein 4